MTAPIKITIVDWTRPRPFIWSLRGPAIQVGVIGIGVLTGSTAMQWAGFLALMLITLAMIMVQVGSAREGMTIEQAKAKIAQLESLK